MNDMHELTKSKFAIFLISYNSINTVLPRSYGQTKYATYKHGSFHVLMNKSFKLIAQNNGIFIQY